MTRSKTQADLPSPSLEERLGHRFQRADLLLQALTHSSFANESEGSAADNEALEFLGDAVLSFLVAEHLFRAGPGSREGAMSRAKAFLVSDANLAALARNLGVGQHLRLGVGEERSGGRDKSSLLSGALEALVAAVFLDGGARAARAVVRRLFRPQASVASGRLPPVDHKTALQEHLQGHGLPIPSYATVEAAGPDHRKRFRVRAAVDGRVLGEGEGATKKAAEQSAAQQSLARLTPEQAARGSGTPKDRRSGTS